MGKFSANAADITGVMYIEKKTNAVLRWDGQSSRLSPTERLIELEEPSGNRVLYAQTLKDLVGSCHDEAGEVWVGDLIREAFFDGRARKRFARQRVSHAVRMQLA